MEVGDIVLARVARTTYLLLVSAIDAAAGRVQISNNRGKVNGWVPSIVVVVAAARPCGTRDGVARITRPRCHTGRRVFVGCTSGRRASDPAQRHGRGPGHEQAHQGHDRFRSGFSAEGGHAVT
jgi:hypothetical protein